MQPDAVRDSTRTLGRRRLTPSAAPPTRWTLELLNKERVQTLKDMCKVQGLGVPPSANKKDLVAALLADQDSHPESSNIESQAQCDSSEVQMEGDNTCENGDEVLGANPLEAAWEGGAGGRWGGGGGGWGAKTGRVATRGSHMSLKASRK
jgi:hypothetical protein